MSSMAELELDTIAMAGSPLHPVMQSPTRSPPIFAVSMAFTRMVPTSPEVRRSVSVTVDTLESMSIRSTDAKGWIVDGPYMETLTSPSEESIDTVSNSSFVSHEISNVTVPLFEFVSSIRNLPLGSSVTVSVVPDVGLRVTTGSAVAIAGTRCTIQRRLQSRIIVFSFVFVQESGTRVIHTRAFPEPAPGLLCGIHCLRCLETLCQKHRCDRGSRAIVFQTLKT